MTVDAARSQYEDFNRGIECIENSPRRIPGKTEVLTWLGSGLYRGCRQSLSGCADSRGDSRCVVAGYCCRSDGLNHGSGTIQ